MDKDHDEELSEGSSGSDASSYVSSFDGEDSSEGQESPNSTPRPAHEPVPAGLTTLPVHQAPGQLSPKRMPKPKIPALGLRLDLQRGAGSSTPRATPESARGRPAFAIPRLFGAERPSGDAAQDCAAHDEPAALTRRESCPNTGIPPLPRQHLGAAGRCDADRSQDQPVSTVSVGLLSPAVVVDVQQSGSPGAALPARVLSRVGAALGVAQRELTLFEVREVSEATQLDPGARCLAVAVKSSGTLRPMLALTILLSCHRTSCYVLGGDAPLGNIPCGSRSLHCHLSFTRDGDRMPEAKPCAGVQTFRWARWSACWRRTGG